MTLKIPSSSKILCTPTRQPQAYSPLSCGGCSHSHSSQDSRFLIWAISVYFHQLSHPLFITLQAATSRAWCGAPWPGSLLLPAPPPAMSHCAAPFHLALLLHGSALSILTQDMGYSLPQAPNWSAGATE